MKTTSAPSYSTEFINTMAVEETTPFDIVALREELQASLEERFQQGPLTVHIDRSTTIETILKAGPLCEVVEADPVMGFMATELAAFRERRRLADARWTQKSMLFSNFGKWLQKDEKAIVVAAKEGLETLDDRLAVLPYIVEKIRSRKGWKAEQSAAQAPENYVDTSLDYDLPPRTKGRSHAPAYYRITGPSGRTIDLSEPHGSFKPILSNNPNDAFRRFITRLGKDVRGGETELLNMLLKADRVEFTNAQGEVSYDYKWLPSYVSQLVDGVWFVTVGWKLNPKCQYGTFHRESADGYVMPFIENAAGELEPFIPGIHSESDILSTSQLDYKLLCEDSGMAVVDKNEDVVSYMNEDEELVMQGFMRDDDHANEEMDSFLLTQAASDMDRLIDMRTESAVWLLPDFEATVLEHTKSVGAQCHALKKAIASKKAQIGDFVLALADGQLIDPDEVTGKLLSAELRSLQWKLDNTRANYRLASEDLKSQVNQTAWFDAHPRECVPTPRSSALDAFSAPLPATVNVTGQHAMAGSNLTIIPGASNEPRNVAVLAKAKITEVDRIVPSVNPLQLLQNGLTRVMKQSDGTYSTQVIKRAAKVHTTPKTASPALKLTLLRMMLGGSPLNA